MSSTDSTFRIPFPRAFLAVNTPVKKASTLANDHVSVEPQPPVSAFLSNRATGHKDRVSISSIASTSDVSTASPPSSPPTKAADSSIPEPTLFSPLAVNTKHLFPAQDLKTLSPVEKSDFLSNRQ